MWFECADCDATGAIEGIGGRSMVCESCWGIGKGTAMERAMAQLEFETREIRDKRRYYNLKCIPAEI
jgi:hypothetical protein